MSRRLTLSLTAFAVFAIGALPVLAMLSNSLLIDGRLDLSAWRGVLASAHQWQLMGNSLRLAALVTIACTAVGVPLGVLLGKTDLPLRRPLALLFSVPLLIPPYIVAVAWSDLLGRDGLLARILGLAMTRADHWLFALPGAAWVLFCVLLPIPMLLTMVFLRTIDPELEQAGRLLTSWRGVLLGISLPLIRPGLALAAMLVFLLAFGEFSVPNFLRVAVFPVESFTQFAAFYDFRAATATALPMAGVTLLLLLVEARFLRDRTARIRPASETGRMPRVSLGRLRRPLFALAAGGALLLVVAPFLVLLIQARGGWSDALRHLGGSLWRSLAYAGIGATLLTLLGFLAGYLIQTRALPVWRALDSLTLFLFALPGTVVGIGLIALWNHPRTQLVYATPAIVILGYLARYMVLTSRVTVSQLEQIPASMEEAARIAGASWPRRLLSIVLPLARRGLLAAWLIAFIFCLRDTDIGMLVYPPGQDTLPVRIFTLMANGAPSMIASLCLLMIATTLLPTGLLWLFLERGMGRR